MNTMVSVKTAHFSALKTPCFLVSAPSIVSAVRQIDRRFVDRRFVDRRFVDRRFVDRRFVDRRFVL
jgi:hypothetical protein